MEMFRIVRFSVRTLVFLAVAEYIAPDFILNSVEVTAKAVGEGVGNGLWALFSTVGHHIIK